MEPHLRIAAPAHATGAVEFIDLGDIGADESFRLRPDGDVSLLATSLGRLGQLAPIELRPWPGAGSDGPRWQVVAGFRRLAAMRLLARERVLARLHGELADEDAWAIALADALLREPLAAAELEALRERLRASGAAPWAEELVDEALVRAPVDAQVRERFFAFLSATPTPTSTLTPEEFPSVHPERSAAESKDQREELPPVHPERSAAESKAEGDGFPSVHPERSAAESKDEGDGFPSVHPERSAAESKDEGGDASDAPIEVTPEELAQDLSARLSALNQDLAVAFEAWSELPPEGRRAIVEQARYIAELMPFLEQER